MRRILSVLVVVWLVVGAIAGGQRGYYGNGNANCAKFGDIVATVFAGPLNYAGVNPKVHCKVPQPSS